MTDISLLLKKAGRVVSDNSPAILTASAVTGAVVTAYLVGRAAYQHGVEDAVEGVPETPRQRFEERWQLYIPATISGAFTVASIIGANRVSTRRNSALLAALSLSERAFDEYRSKVFEQIGKNKEEKVRAAVAQDRVNENPPVDNQVIITGSGDSVFHDAHTGRYFKSNIEKIRKVQNDLNARLMHEGNISLNEFYEAIGIPRLNHGDDFGWGIDNLLNVEFHAVISESGEPCISIEFMKQPSPQYWKYS